MKNILILFLSFLFWQNAKAQNMDTTEYAVMNNGKLAASSKTADYFLFILPVDISSGIKLYPINEYYPSGKPKLNGSSRTNNWAALKFEGPAITYFPKGNNQSMD